MSSAHRKHGATAAGSPARHLLEKLLRAACLAYLLAALVAFLVAIWRLIASCCRRGRDHQRKPADTEGYLPEHAVRIADPVIYSQQWLIDHGLSVTWQNPDFRIEELATPGTAVPAWQLQPGIDYRVLVNVWNGSTSGPAVDVGVELSYLDFGIGGVPIPIGATEVDLPVKGEPGTPVVAEIDWKTPSTPGHYCLQALLVWPHDAEPGNNLGQHNVDVQPFNSPVAEFVVAVRNIGRAAATVRLAVDGYELPDPEPCPPDRDENPPDDGQQERVERHRTKHHRLGDGWTVEFGNVDGDTIPLEPGEKKDVPVRLVAPDGFVGRRAINVQGWDGHRLIGGVTLIGEGAT